MNVADPRIRERQPDPRVIGRILCVNTDGGPQFSVHYGLPRQLRDAELFTEHGVYYQNHQTPTGQWVYKYLRPRAGRPSDPDLSDYREPTDANWDGPQPARPQATWDMVQSMFESFIRDGATPDDLGRIQSLAYAAFHKLPVPDPPVDVAQAIPTAVIE